MKETPRRRKTTVTSSLNEISTDHLGNRVVESWRRYSARPHPFYWTDIYRRRERFSSTSDSFFSVLSNIMSTIQSSRESFMENLKLFKRVIVLQSYKPLHAELHAPWYCQFCHCSNHPLRDFLEFRVQEMNHPRKESPMWI
jgi:hypothetical protein